MAKQCQISGKKPVSGHNVSHSNRKTKRTFSPNLQTKKLVNPATGTIMKVTLSTRSLKQIKKWDAEGKRYDLRTMLQA